VASVNSINIRNAVSGYGRPAVSARPLAAALRSRLSGTGMPPALEQPRYAVAPTPVLVDRHSGATGQYLQQTQWIITSVSDRQFDKHDPGYPAPRPPV
jgi:hypothetical protein